MAILFRILFTLGLLIIHVFVLSEQLPVQVTIFDIETPLRFDDSRENPHHIIINLSSNNPTYLNCHAVFYPEEKLLQDFESSFYPGELIDKIDDYDNDDSEDGEEVKEYYKTQKNIYNKNDTHRTTTDLYGSRSKRAKNPTNHHEEKKVISNESDDQYESDENQEVVAYYQEQKKKYEGENGTSRFKRSFDHEVELHYEWLKDDFPINKTSENETDKRYLQYSNGTLKISSTAESGGRYYCKVKAVVKLTRKSVTLGPIISRSTLVEVGSLINVDSVKKNYTIFEDGSVLIICPISSIPQANVTWNFKDKDLNFQKADSSQNRHFLLTNGSLLIVKAKKSDEGKYRCSATNQFNKKSTRSSLAWLNVQSRSNNDDNQNGNSLLSELQSSKLKIKSGGNLILHCASHVNKISWTFTPRKSDIPIHLSVFHNELKYVNVAAQKHDGIYNCSTETDFQLFDVTILTPPEFTHKVKSRVTSVVYSTRFNCTATGNPMPKVEWYKNGQRIPNNHVKFFEYPIGKIETNDPDDEGLYQCIARNDYGDAVTSIYLHIRASEMLKNVPQDAKCYPMNGNDVLVKFRQEEHINMVQYAIAADSPREFFSTLDKDPSSESFIISHSNKEVERIVKPLRKFYLYMRNMQPVKMSGNEPTKMLLSKLSKPIICSAQGFKPNFSKSKDGIFFTWDAQNVDEPITYYRIQFRYDSSENNFDFDKGIVGTYQISPKLSIENDDFLKIPVHESKKSEENGISWSEISVPGNVTGLYIVKARELSVRILGSTMSDGKLFEQDLRYLYWYNITSEDISVEPIVVSDIESRDAKISWKEFDGIVTCARICTSMKPNPIARDISGMKSNCQKISIEEKIYHLRGLQPNSDYNVYIRDCKNNAISTSANFQTKLDAHGPVSKSYVTIDKGISVHWDPPINANGEIFHYTISWDHHNVTHERNVSENTFKFPNTTESDRFNFTIRAYGVAGYGNPLIINSDKWINLPKPRDFGRSSGNNSLYVILIIVITSIGILALAIGCIVCRRHRYCKQNGIISSEQSSFQPPASPLAANIRMDEMYEMQTLISTSQTLMSNGKDLQASNIKMENTSNGGMNITENQKILRTSTPTDEAVDQICIELPPIKRDEVLTFQTNDDRSSSAIDVGVMELNFSPQLTMTTMAIDIATKKDARNASMRVNGGNLSPYKSLQSSGNDPNTSSTPSSFESQRQLIGSNLCIGMYNNNNINNNASSSIDRSRVGKSSSIESEDDSEENLNDYDLNDSNLSSKPLNPITWDFRCPLVGPNG